MSEKDPYEFVDETQESAYFTQESEVNFQESDLNSNEIVYPFGYEKENFEYLNCVEISGRRINTEMFHRTIDIILLMECNNVYRLICIFC